MPTATVIHAPTMDFLKESAAPSQQQVPAIVRNIHQRLMSQVTVDAWLQIDIVRLAEEHPADVVLTLLRCAPTCDRFVVRAMKALLCRLQWDHVLVAMERKRGWDTMMRAITQEYGLGLLASKEKPCYDLIFLTVLVEVLECLDLSKCRGSALKTMAKYLWSECCHRHYLALRGLAVLTKDTWMARRMYPLSKRLLELLGAPDVEVVSMSLCVFMNVLQHQDILVSSTTAPKLTEALLLLFDHVRGTRADQAGKVPVLKVQLHKTVELQILLSSLEPLEFGRAKLSML
ncbi:hypothetical protein RLOC_00010601 [Lonchura striata]|uniref:Uncharacterized protein n=1 Tax=Lonchura striata TaxID=40157 RepID=A0A218U711_9PASE|nr:hypothetical protein RLOC_00010601 [Lonchura striata domestica]